jgi:hypothetical protein
MSGIDRGNKLWEGSRMILPEHREQYLTFRQGLQRTERLEFDEQQMEIINDMLADALNADYEVTFLLCSPERGEYSYSGRLLKAADQKLKIKQASGRTIWAPLGDLIAIQE